MCFFRSILHGRMTFCHVADSPKSGPSNSASLDSEATWAKKYMWEVSDVQTLPKVLGAWWFLGIAWWKTSSHAFFPMKNFFCFNKKWPQKNARRLRLLGEWTYIPCDTTPSRLQSCNHPNWCPFQLSKLPGSTDLCTKTSWPGNACEARNGGFINNIDDNDDNDDNGIKSIWMNSAGCRYTWSRSSTNGTILIKFNDVHCCFSFKGL